MQRFDWCNWAILPSNHELHHLSSNQELRLRCHSQTKLQHQDRLLVHRARLRWTPLKSQTHLKRETNRANRHAKRHCSLDPINYGLSSSTKNFRFGMFFKKSRARMLPFALGLFAIGIALHMAPNRNPARSPRVTCAI